jgi:hypothetical protein
VVWDVDPTGRGRCLGLCPRPCLHSLAPIPLHPRGPPSSPSVREKAKQLVELLNDTARIREEREKARALRDKYVGIAGDDRFGGKGQPTPRWSALLWCSRAVVQLTACGAVPAPCFAAVVRLFHLRAPAVWATLSPWFWLGRCGGGILFFGVATGFGGSTSRHDTYGGHDTRSYGGSGSRYSERDGGAGPRRSHVTDGSSPPTRSYHDSSARDSGSGSGASWHQAPLWARCGWPGLFCPFGTPSLSPSPSPSPRVHCFGFEWSGGPMPRASSE